MTMELLQLVFKSSILSYSISFLMIIRILELDALLKQELNKQNLTFDESNASTGSSMNRNANNNMKVIFI